MSTGTGTVIVEIWIMMGICSFIIGGATVGATIFAIITMITIIVIAIFG